MVNQVAVTVNKKFGAKIEKTVRKILRLYDKGIRITLTDIKEILKRL